MRLTLVAMALVGLIPAIASAQDETYLTRRGYVACADKANTAKALTLNNDYNARGADAFVSDKANHCSFLKSGIKVVLVSTADNLVEIRADGATETLWTTREAIGRK